VKLTRAAFPIVFLLAFRCAGVSERRSSAASSSLTRRPRASTLRFTAPELTAPLSEGLPAQIRPSDPVKAAVFDRVNRDRAAEGVPFVEWDERASQVADSFCAQQIRERSRGHFLMDGIPPYARTGFAGAFGMQSENSLSWITTAPAFSEGPEALALAGHQRMLEETPPNDGHRKTILDPEATHVGVGYALAGGRFQMAQEFMTRRLERLELSRGGGPGAIVRVEGKTAAPHRLQFVTIAREPPPRPLTREEANSRTSYSYPQFSLAYLPEGHRSVFLVGAATQDRIRLKPGREFSFTLTANEPGLWTIVFHTAVRGIDRARPGGSAVIWVDRGPAP